MKVAIFFDGKNFYAGWREQAYGQRLHFTRLARWLVQRVGGTTLVGCHYYTGVETSEEASSDGQKKLAGFLDMLELQPGFFVHRFPRKSRIFRCIECGAENRFSQEKEVDTAMVADMVRLAAIHAYDIMILVSGDADYASVAEAVQQLGKIVYVVSWGGTGLSFQLRKVAFDHIDLLEGLSEFEDPTLPWNPPESMGVATGSQPPPAGEEGDYSGPSPSSNTPAPPQDLADVFVEQLRLAEASFKGGYVGANYFVTRWKGPGFDVSSYDKRRVLDHLVKEGIVELYEVDGNKALRLRRTGLPPA
ncbi:MAG: NYN domain-containing protein [Myxococcales bacterium]|nr:NYN domain-containing protein [Polyangiaceae bacterium]MDW8250271.1 NYN domain-containing protein [Myxococcales bacterium]